MPSVLAQDGQGAAGAHAEGYEGGTAERARNGMEELVEIMTEKICTTCKNTLPFESFSKKHTSSDGMDTRCKDCISKYFATYYTLKWEKRIAASKEYYNSHKAESNARTKAYASTDKGKVVQRKSDLKRIAKNPERIIARRILNTEVYYRGLKRQPCEKCGAPKTEAHHHKGYAVENALDVRWLCAKCHRLEEVRA